jgi:hypothetical protein
MSVTSGGVCTFVYDDVNDIVKLFAENLVYDIMII